LAFKKKKEKQGTNNNIALLKITPIIFDACPEVAISSAVSYN